MRKMLCQVVPFLLLAAMPLTSFASVSSLFLTDGTKNEVKFVNREVFMRQDQTGAWNPVLAESSRTAGVQRGDVLVTLFSATTLSYGSNLVNSGWLPGDANSSCWAIPLRKSRTFRRPRLARLVFIALDFGNVNVIRSACWMLAIRLPFSIQRPNGSSTPVP